jgi:RNA polymerase sigma-70 factor (ECF subfamily)
MNYNRYAIEPPVTLDHDAELMLRVRQGDVNSFAILLNKHRPAIVRFIYRKLKNLGMAEELSQEVFLRVYRSRQSYQATAKFRTWLYRIATNLTLNSLRDSKNDAWRQRRGDAPTVEPLWQIPDGRPSVEERLVRQVRCAEVRQAIAELPTLQRSAVLMQRYREMEYAEIARALRCSESAVKSLVFRAHEALRHRLAYLVPMENPREAASDLLNRLAS